MLSTALAGSVVNVTVTGCVGGPLNFALIGAGASVPPLQVDFSRPIAGSAVNPARRRLRRRQNPAA